MASIRKLKKDLNYLSYELLTEAFAFKHFHPEMEEKKFDDIILSIVRKRNELIARINDKDEIDDSNPGKTKKHFSSIRKDMYGMIDIMKDFSKN